MACLDVKSVTGTPAPGRRYGVPSRNSRAIVQGQGYRTVTVAMPAPGATETFSPHYARSTCCDCGYGHSSLQVVGSVSRKPVGADSSRDRMARGREVCSAKAHSRGIDSGERGRDFRAGWWWKARRAFLSVKEGRCSECALRRRPSLPLTPLRLAGPVARPSPRSHGDILCIMRVSRIDDDASSQPAGPNFIRSPLFSRQAGGAPHAS